MHRSWVHSCDVHVRALRMYVILALLLGTAAWGLAAAPGSAWASAATENRVGGLDGAAPLALDYSTVRASGDPKQSPAPRRSRTMRLKARNLPRSWLGCLVRLPTDTPVATTVLLVSASADPRCARIVPSAEACDRRHERLALASRAGHLAVPPPSSVQHFLEVA